MVMKKLKTILILLTLGLIFLSCQKPTDCNCGFVAAERIDSDGDEFTFYITVENDCTGQWDTFQITREEWRQVSVGTSYCMKN